MSSLLIELASVQESPRRFLLQCDAASWEHACESLRETDVPMARPFTIDLQGHRIGARLLFRGRLEGGVELQCGRCLEAYAHGFDEPVELLLEPAPVGQEPPPGGILLDAEDLELGTYVGDELDFEPLLLEILALNWPMQPRCDESCRGLCPGCGGNRNRDECGCPPPPGLRPFEGLAKMLAASREGRTLRRR